MLVICGLGVRLCEAVNCAGGGATLRRRCGDARGHTFMRGGVGQWHGMAQGGGGGGRMPNDSWIQWPRVPVPSVARCGSGTCPCDTRGMEDNDDGGSWPNVGVGGFLDESLNDGDARGHRFPCWGILFPIIFFLGRKSGPSRTRDSVVPDVTPFLKASH
jgi:hypothetical protein